MHPALHPGKLPDNWGGRNGSEIKDWEEIHLQEGEGYGIEVSDRGGSEE